MKKFLMLMTLAILGVTTACGPEEVNSKVIVTDYIPTEGYVTPESYDGMTLIWQDEFSGSGLNSSDWNYELGTGNNGWGNAELQYYTEVNAEVERNDFLVITAKREELNGSSYTSSRITTEDNFDFKYGRVDIRAALPRGQGLWPALWMLGANFRTAGWPACGEIDIMESGEGGNDDKVLGTTHWDQNGHVSYGGSKEFENNELTTQFHVFSIVWNETSIRWYVDDSQYHVIDTTPAELSEFQENFFLIFNVAVGGHFPGNPDGSTSFPQRMVVDYVRVFQDN